MMTEGKTYIGKRMKWDEIKATYPDRWVALTDFKKYGPTILEAVLLRVCEEKDMYSAEMELREKGIPFIWRRTTELEGANIICLL